MSLIAEMAERDDATVSPAGTPAGTAGGRGEANGQARGFVDRLRELAEAGQEDRAALAALRRGLGKMPGEAAEMYPHVVPRLPPDIRPADEWAYYLIAALFAWHPSTWPRDDDDAPRRSLGASFARLRRQTDSDSAERTMVVLLNSHGDDLPDRLRRAVGLLRSHEVPVEWAQLLRDLLLWDVPTRDVQRRWAREFWGERRAEEAPVDRPEGPAGTPDGREANG